MAENIMVDKIMKLFKPSYAIYCNQGSGWGSPTLGTKEEISTVTIFQRR